FYRNWRITFMLDQYAVRNRHACGVRNLMWSTDYPHHGTDWPYSRKSVREMCHAVPADEQQRILALNAAELYRIGGHARAGGGRAGGGHAVRGEGGRGAEGDDLPVPPPGDGERGGGDAPPRPRRGR